MREHISIHLGTPGIQIANKSWELFSIEHSLHNSNQSQSSSQIESDPKLNSFYIEQNNVFKPRALFIDSDPCLSSALSFPGSSLISSDQIIQTQPSFNNYAIGYSVLGPSIHDQLEESIRCLVEPCSDLQGFLIYGAIDGGVAGLGNYLLESLDDNLSKHAKVGVNLFPTEDVDDMKFYNALLAFGGFLDKIDACFYIENQAISRIYKQILGLDSPSFPQINELISELNSHLTTSLRFEDNFDLKLSNYIKDYIPYPTAKYLVSSIAPLISKFQINKTVPHCAQSTMNCYSNSYLFSNTHLNEGKMLSSSISFRGDIVPKDISCTIGTIKPKRIVEFFDWTPTGFKCRLNKELLKGFEESLFERSTREVCMVSNTSAIKMNLIKLRNNFDRVFQDKRFLFKFLEAGAEESEFEEGKDLINLVIDDFLEMEKEVNEEGNDED